MSLKKQSKNSQVVKPKANSNQMRKRKVVIQAKNISKRYGKLQVFENFNLTIRQGERVAFVAANGVGKSTLMEVLANIRPIDKGKIYLDPKAKLGIQFQESKYPFGITVKSMIDFYLDVYNIKLTKKELEKQLSFFQITDFYKKQIVMLSGGQQQRVNLFLALCSDPDIWFLDEVTTGLDIKFRSIILHYIDQLLTGDKTLLLVSHNSQEIDHLCNRLVVLDKNTLICDVRRNQVNDVFGSIEIFVEYFFNELDSETPKEKKQIITNYLTKKREFVNPQIESVRFSEEEH